MPATGIRLAACLAASLTLHLAALGLVELERRPEPTAWPDPPVLHVELAPWPPPNRPGARPSPRPADARPAPAGAPIPPLAPDTPVAATAQAAVPQPGPTPKLEIAALLSAARAIARETMPPSLPDREPADRPILPELARALRREAAGERHLEQGLIRVVNADGRSYCLQAPPGFAHGGPTDALAVPSLCP